MVKHEDGETAPPAGEVVTLERAPERGLEETPDAVRASAAAQAMAYVRRRRARRPGGRALGLAALAGAIAAAALGHALLYPRTFNGRPPAAVRIDPTAPEWRSRGDDPPRSAGARAAGARVAVVVVDGLRDDALAALALPAGPAFPAGDGRPAPIARCTIEAGWPSYSRASYTTLGTGAPPALTGVHTNRFRGPVELDSVFVRARAAGLRVGAVADDVAWWGELFPAGWDDHRAGVEELRAAAARLFATGPEGLGFDLALLHTVVADASAHAWGAASAAYRRSLAETAAWLGPALGRMDPARDTLVLVSDHGHLDRGGHGGPEPVVLNVPLVLAGRGVRALPAASCPIGATTSDVAPTVAALAGVAPPRHAVGRPLVELLDLPPAELEAVGSLAGARRAALAAALGAPGAEPWAALPPPRGRALLPAAFASAGWLGLLGLLGLVARGRRPPEGPGAAGRGPRSSWRGGERLRAVALALVYPASAVGVVWLLEPVLSFSAVRQGTVQYAGRLLVLLSGPVLLGLAAQLLAWRGGRHEDPRAGLSARALAVGLAAAPWIIAVGLHGSPLAGPALGDPHLSFFVVLGAAITALGCSALAVLLLMDYRREANAAAGAGAGAAAIAAATAGPSSPALALAAATRPAPRGDR